MKMTLAEVLSKQKALGMILEKKIPYKLSYAVAKNMIALERENEAINKGRMSLIDTYAVKDELDKPVIKDGRYDLGKNEEQYNKEYNEYMKTETKVEVYTVSQDILEELNDPRYDVLPPMAFISLDFMIEKPKESKKKSSN